MNIIIPAYQPDHKLIELIQTIKKNSDYNILIVNDGSDNHSSSVFAQAVELGCVVLNHEQNRGKGAALRTAFQYLLSSDTTQGIITADCDGQHTWQDIEQLATELPSHLSTILLGSRQFVGKIPFRSRFGNYITGSIFSLLTGEKLRDTQTGLRGYNADMLPWLVDIEGNRYEYEMNQLLEAKKAGYHFHCIPIETIYENNNKESHFNPIRDSIRIYLPILKFGFSSITCGVIDFALLLLLKRITEDLLVSVIGARIISSLCNYVLNKHLVFDAKTEKRITTLIQYYLLVIFILTCNYLLLFLFHEILGINLVFGKLLTEALLFLASYTIQHRIIFRYNK